MEGLGKEFNFYQKKKQEFLSQYKGKFIVIIEEKVVGVYDDKFQAINETKEKHTLGTFLVQHVIEGDDIAFFHSKVLLKHEQSA